MSENVRESLRGCELGTVFGFYIPCDFYLCESSKDEVYETNPHILEEWRYNTRSCISISGDEFERVNSVFRCYTECMRSGGGHRL